MRIGAAHRPLRAVILDELRTRITHGQLPPGTRLIESALAEEFEVSRVPVREAIRMLEIEGFVTVAPRRGAVVAEVSYQDAIELFEIRSVLESLAARLAASRATPAQLRELRQLTEPDHLPTSNSSKEVITGFNAEFHRFIATLAGNDMLAALVGQLRDRLTWIFSRTAVERSDDSTREHLDLVAAICEGDAERAAAQALAHVAAARQAFESGIEKANAS